jgi:hypothetical protein
MRKMYLVPCAKQEDCACHVSGPGVSRPRTQTLSTLPITPCPLTTLVYLASSAGRSSCGDQDLESRNSDNRRQKREEVAEIRVNSIVKCETPTTKDISTFQPEPENEVPTEVINSLAYTNAVMLEYTTNVLILPFPESKVGISALFLDDALSFRVTHAHADLKGRRFPRLPKV